MASSIGTRLAASLALLVAIEARAAHAEPSKAEVALAQQSFDEARALFTAGRVHEACEKFAASQHLDPREGTLLNLAICHEKEGKTASAWLEYSDALATARAEGQESRAKFAADHVDLLAPRLSHLRIAVGPGVRAPGFVLELDGAPLQEVAWGTDLPVDPGAHTIAASAPRRVAWRATATVGGSGDRSIVDVPDLAQAVDDAPAAPATQASGSAQTPPVSGRRVALYAAGSAVAVGIGVVAVFGGLAIAQRHDAENLCTQSACGISAQSANSAGVRDAWVSDIGVGVAVVGAAVGAYLLLTGAATEPPRVGSRIPVVTGRGASLEWVFE